MSAEQDDRAEQAPQPYLQALAGAAVNLFATLQQLKRVPRTGWLDRGVPPLDVESVADHSCLTALVAWTLALDDPELDATRVLKLAMIHDLAEAIAGDPPPYEPRDLPDPSDSVAVRAFFSVRHHRTPGNRAAKQRAEEAAFDQIASLLGSHARAELVSLWEEYEARETSEARFVKEVDTFEAFLQAHHYASVDPELPLFGFTDMALHEITHPTLVAIRDAVLADEDYDKERTKTRPVPPHERPS